MLFPTELISMFPKCHVSCAIVTIKFGKESRPKYEIHYPRGFGLLVSFIMLSALLGGTSLIAVVATLHVLLSRYSPATLVTKPGREREKESDIKKHTHITELVNND